MTKYRDDKSHIATSPILSMPEKSGQIQKSYLSSPRYLAFLESIKKYDLSQSKSSDKTVRFASKIREEFKKDYGVIKSSSMEYFISKDKYKVYDSLLLYKINQMRKKCRVPSQAKYIENLSKAVKADKIGNCADVSLICAKEIFDKKSDYKASVLDLKMVTPGNIFENHVAVLVSPKNEKGNGLNSKSVIVDNWLGGVYYYKDWQKIIKKVFKPVDIIVNADDSVWNNFENHK